MPQTDGTIARSRKEKRDDRRKRASIDAAFRSIDRLGCSSALFVGSRSRPRPDPENLSDGRDRCRRTPLCRFEEKDKLPDEGESRLSRSSSPSSLPVMPPIGVPSAEFESSDEESAFGKGSLMRESPGMLAALARGERVLSEVDEFECGIVKGIGGVGPAPKGIGRAGGVLRPCDRRRVIASLARRSSSC